jgi:Cof subfamily protein (haloacid dehalogenase superfamily)
MPRPLIATDLDGTLLMTGSQEVHADAREAVHRAVAAGIPVVFATGRAPVDIVHIAEMVGHRWFAVCSDGASIVDMRTDTVLQTRPLSLTAKQNAVAAARAFHSDVKFLVDRVVEGEIQHGSSGLVIERGFEAPWADAIDAALHVDSIDEVLNDPTIVKMCAFIDQSAESHEVFDGLHRAVHNFVHPIKIQSEKVFLDMASKGVSKATGVEIVASFVGVDVADIFAVGDLHNDVDLLDWAGFSFAVENAHPRVKDVADVIVPSNDAGGVAAVITEARQHLERDA